MAVHLGKKKVALTVAHLADQMVDGSASTLVEELVVSMVERLDE